MFNNFWERRKSEDGTIVSVYILGAAILFIATLAMAFALGKYAQAQQSLQRCTEMVAKGTMVYMQRQAPPNKGALTEEAKNEGIFIFNEGLCNSGLPYVPLMKSTQTFSFETVGTDTLLVTIDQYVKGYSLSQWVPIKISSTAAAYTYQYGGQGRNPVYN